MSEVKERKYVGTFCTECRVSFKRQAILAVLIQLGAQTRDPNHCHATEDNEHKWERKYEEPTDD